MLTLARLEQVRGGPAGHFEGLNVICVEAGMSSTRLCKGFGMPSGLAPLANAKCG